MFHDPDSYWPFSTSVVSVQVPSCQIPTTGNKELLGVSDISLLYIPLPVCVCVLHLPGPQPSAAEQLEGPRALRIKSFASYPMADLCSPFR